MGMANYPPHITSLPNPPILVAFVLRGQIFNVMNSPIKDV
jgi:hypothetical protein